MVIFIVAITWLTIWSVFRFKFEVRKYQKDHSNNPILESEPRPINLMRVFRRKHPDNSRNNSL